VRRRAVEIRLLGELEVLHDGRPQTLPASKKTRALLGYLVATERSHLRERLCDLFWEVPDDPRASLRWSLTKIRPLLDDTRVTRLMADRERVGFAVEGAVVDLAVVRRELGKIADASTPALRAAAKLFRGEFLDGLDLIDCYRYHEWCIGERESIRALRLSIVQTLFERVRADPEEALRYARALVAIDPLAEGAHVAVIQLLGELGRPHEALKQYDACRRILESELRSQPSPELERARRALAQPAAAGRAAPTVAAEPPVAPLRSTAPLVGRNREREILEQHVAAASAGRAHPALIFVGEPGIGKTRLLDEVRTLVHALGGGVLAGRAFEAEMVRPYGAFIDALRSIKLDRTDAGLRADLATLLPELGAQREGTDRNRLFDGVVRLLLGLGATTPVALLLDDVHWLDDASAALLHFVVRAICASAGSRVVIVCAARSGELADNPAARTLVRALTRDDMLQQLELRPLDASGIAALLDAIDPALDGKRVFGESAGNPLFALEVARALRQSGEPSSHTLDGLIDDRLASLDDRARDLLPWAAALGRGFDLDILTRTTGLTSHDLLAAIEELERHGIVRANTTDEGYDFSHDLIRRASYRQLSGPRRRLVHLQIARVLASRLDPEGTLAADVAHHAGRGGDHELAARACITAGEHCLRLFANAGAMEIVERGMAHLPALQHDLRVHLRIRLLKIRVVAASTAGAIPGGSRLARTAPELEAELSRAVGDAQASGRLEDAATGFLALAALAHDTGDFRKAEDATLQAADAARGSDPAIIAAQLAQTARCLAQLDGDITRARSLIGEARAIAERLGIDIAELYWGLGLISYWDGEYDSSTKLLERARAAARRDQDRWRECGCLIWLTIIELESGRTAEALALCSELMPMAARMGEGSEVPFAAALDALSRLTAGEAGADERVNQAMASLRLVDSKAHLAYALNFAAAIDLRNDRVGSARRRAEEALAAAEAVKRRSEGALSRALLAQAAIADGERDEATRYLLPVLGQAGDPCAVHARARQALISAAQMLGMAVSTLAQTQNTTPNS
jgi:DNA-binding SARP family transcriptional activator